MVVPFRSAPSSFVPARADYRRPRGPFIPPVVRRFPAPATGDNREPIRAIRVSSVASRNDEYLNVRDIDLAAGRCIPIDQIGPLFRARYSGE